MKTSNLKRMALASVMLAGVCGSAFSGGQVFAKSKETSGIIHLTFQTQPDPPITQFWKQTAALWNKSHPNIQVSVGVTPDVGGTIEYPLLTALANGTGPDMTDAIWTGFGAQLSEFGKAYPLNKLPGFMALLKSQNMLSVAGNYKYKGSYFAIPEYLNPTMLVWNKQILNKMGLSTPPRTYGQLLALKNKLPKGVYLTVNTTTPLWWQMWFSYIAMYDAATGGKPYWSSTKALFDNGAGMAPLNFIYAVFKNHLAPLQSFTKDPVATGVALGYSSVSGPWSLPYYKSTYPKFQYLLSPPLVPDNYPQNKPIYTYGDSKGIGILSHNPTIVNASWQFLKWYFSSPKLQAEFFKLTSLPPARTDILTNPVFASVIKGHPHLQVMLKELPYSRVMVPNPQTELLQHTFNQVVWDPLVQGKETPKQAMQAGVQAINQILGGK
ncbi:MAG: extracellular solute-binding protein [Bacilli bacterium]